MNEESVVVQNGVTVTKSFSQDEFPVPAVTFEVLSTRDEPVDLRIADTIPEGFGVEQIGFHPEYGSEHWTATGNGEVKFERTIEAEAEFTTVYGVRMSDDDEPEMFLQKPTVVVNPTETVETDETVPEESSSVVRELARGERKTVPGLGEDAQTDTEEPDEQSTDKVDTTDEPLEELTAETQESATPGTEKAEPSETESGEHSPAIDEPAETDEEQAVDEPAESDDEPVLKIGDEPETVEDYEDIVETEDPVIADVEDAIEPETEPEQSKSPDTEPPETESAAEGTAESAESTTVQSMHPESESESLVAAFAAEIEAGTVDEDDMAVIREAVVDGSESDRVRIEHLQSRMSDLEAYSDAIKAFIDENGTAQELLADLEADIETVEIEMDAMDERLEAAAAERATMSEHLESLEDTVEAVAGVAERIERVRGDLDALDERVDGVEETTMELETVAEEVESVKADLEELSAWRDQLSDVF